MKNKQSSLAPPFMGTLFGMVSLVGLVGLATGQAVPDQEQFQPVAHLAGSCWEGTFPDGKVKDRHCWEWTLDGAYLRDRHELLGSEKPYSGETFYGWDSDTQVLRFWYFNSIGGRSEGAVESIEGETRWLLTENYEGVTTDPADPGKLQMRNFLVVEEDHYTVVTERLSGETWEEIMSVRFARQD